MVANTPASTSTAYDKLQLTYFKETREKGSQQVLPEPYLPRTLCMYMLHVFLKGGRKKREYKFLREYERKKEMSPVFLGSKELSYLEAPLKRASSLLSH